MNDFNANEFAYLTPFNYECFNLSIQFANDIWKNIHNVSFKRLPVLKTMKDNKRLFLIKREKN